MLIALMDTKDLGLACEMGVAFERNVPIFQLYTDIRLDGNDKKTSSMPWRMIFFKMIFYI